MPNHSPNYSKVTNEIRITVEPAYLDDQSEPDEGRFVWAYHVVIENLGRETVRLLTRHWKITDAIGRVHEVRGPGVVGEQPILAPGESFEYTSGTPLGTSSGIMLGSYEMESATGERFSVAIPPFSLDSPYTRTTIN